MCKNLLAVVLLIVLSAPHGFSKEYTPTSEQRDSIPAHSPKREKAVKHRIYLGAKVGVAFVLGFETKYIIEVKKVSRLYLATAVQSSLIVSSANAGGGLYLGKSNLGLGFRYHYLHWFESEKEGQVQSGYGPELVWNRTIGTRYIVNMNAGGVITKGAFFPDISFGIFIPLTR